MALGPVVLAMASPYLAFRSWVYIGAGFAGILGLSLILLQPLLIHGRLPGVTPLLARRLHRVLGIALLALVVVHVGGLWLTSPPDVIDALLFRSPAPFSVWGVLAMWAVFASAAAALWRARLRRKTWRRLHLALGMVIAGGTVAHALLIEGAMEPVSKALLSVAVLSAAGWAFWHTRLR